jgi:uncharacterized membrane protein
MSSLESSKNLAGIGTILLILSFIPVVGIIGIILLLIGLKGLSEYYKDESIYKNAIWGVLFGIVGIIAVTVVILGLLIGSVSIGMTTTTPSAGTGFGLPILLALVLVFVFYVLMALYFRKAFSALAQRSGEHNFETAGTLLFVGAILTIVFGIGLLLIFVAWIFATIAFFSVKVPSQPYANIAPPTATQPTQATRYCPNCGAPVNADAVFCPHCGKQLT